MLMDWEKMKPQSSEITHVWIFQDNEIKIEESEGHKTMHCQAFGSEAWEISERGYYYSDEGLVSCHSQISGDLEKKLERAFEEACYKCY